MGAGDVRENESYGEVIDFLFNDALRSSQKQR